MSIYVKVNDNLYPATISGRIQDEEWDNRDTKSIKLEMSCNDVIELFVDGISWSIVQDVERQVERYVDRQVEKTVPREVEKTIPKQVERQIERIYEREVEEEVEVLDDEGNPVLDENGEVLTRIEKHTVQDIEYETVYDTIYETVFETEYETVYETVQDVVFDTVIEQEVFDNSEYCLSGDVVDHRNGFVTIKMGKLTEVEILTNQLANTLTESEIELAYIKGVNEA